MYHEKIFKRKDGSRVMVKIKFILISDVPTWERMVFTCEPKKRTFTCVVNHDDYQFRALPFGGEERKNFIAMKNKEFASIQEMQETEKELWQKLKP